MSRAGETTAQLRAIAPRCTDVEQAPVTPPKAPRKARQVNPALLIVMVLVFSSCILLPALYQYSALIFLPAEWKRIPLSEEARQALIATHRFIVVGGPHRGGTTLLWQLLAAHPAVSGFAEHVDSDYSEGAFLQTVLPTFNVGMETMLKGQGVDVQAVPSGLGSYALSPAAHLTEAHPLNSNESSGRLLSEWGFYWNLSRPVLLEKTPTDMTVSRLLQALLAPSATFIFISRHPLAVSLAHKKWPCCRTMSVGSLVVRAAAASPAAVPETLQRRSISLKLLRGICHARAPPEPAAPRLNLLPPA